MNILNKKQWTVDMLNIKGDALADLILLVQDGKVSRTNAKKILTSMFDDESIEPEAYAKAQGFIVSNDTGLIESVIKNVLAAEAKSVADYKSGKEKALMAIFGRCMRELKGNCDPQMLRTLLIDNINKL